MKNLGWWPIRLRGNRVALALGVVWLVAIVVVVSVTVGSSDDDANPAPQSQASSTPTPTGPATAPADDGEQNVKAGEIVTDGAWQIAVPEGVASIDRHKTPSGMPEITIGDSDDFMSISDQTTQKRSDSVIFAKSVQVVHDGYVRSGGPANKCQIRSEALTASGFVGTKKSVGPCPNYTTLKDPSAGGGFPWTYTVFVGKRADGARVEIVARSVSPDTFEMGIGMLASFQHQAKAN